MGKTYLRRMRWFYAFMSFSITALVLMSLFGASHELHANDVVQQNVKNYVINGREYQENGIIFDVPKESDSSREAAVVSFPNHAVIPSFITVGGIQYTVRTVRAYSSQTLFEDTTGWVTLPPTLKNCDLHGTKTVDEWYDRRAYGVANVNISDLDSFLNMESFHQWWELKTGMHIKQADWKLYLNNRELKDYDYVYPEGSTLGTSLAYLVGVNSITIPASDTARQAPVNWYPEQPEKLKYRPKKIQFKADSGYDLRNYAIIADSIVFPRGLTEFHGYGTNGEKNVTSSIRIKVAKWPDNLKVIASTKGLERLYFDELPESVIKIGGTAGESCGFYVKDKLIISPKWQELGRVGFVIDGKSVYIEDSEQPLYLNGYVDLGFGQDTTKLYIGRNLVLQNDNCRLEAVVKDKTLTIIIGDKVTEIPDKLPVKLEDYSATGKKIPVKPKYLVCMGMTPPNFKSVLPEILDWKFETVLVVPEAAEQAYRNHPVWKYFYIMLTHDVNRIPVDKDVVREQWYTLDGKLLAEPEPGKVNIRVSIYSDGTISSHKVAIPQ